MRTTLDELEDTVFQHTEAIAKLEGCGTEGSGLSAEIVKLQLRVATLERKMQTWDGLDSLYSGGSKNG